jgi:hypothetical protein
MHVMVDMKINGLNIEKEMNFLRVKMWWLCYLIGCVNGNKVIELII